MDHRGGRVSRTKVGVGDPAPDFTLPDQTGTPVRLSDLVGRKAVVLYFYPKDQTPGCTVEEAEAPKVVEAWAD